MVLLVLMGMALGQAGADYTVALDPGHGGSQHGAPGPGGLLEKDVTLDIARRIERRLDERGKVNVVLCRTGDILVPVRARVRCANRAGARLFLSLHANATPGAGTGKGRHRGFEIYLSPVADVDADVKAATALARDPVEAAWRGHRIRAAANEARTAAQRVAWRLGDALGVDRDRGIKQGGAMLDVLQGLEMPGLLVEVGFLDHPEEGLYLASEEGRETIAGALAKAIEDLRARELRGRTDPAITTRRPTRPSSPPP